MQGVWGGPGEGVGSFGFVLCLKIFELQSEESSLELEVWSQLWDRCVNFRLIREKRLDLVKSN